MTPADIRRATERLTAVFAKRLQADNHPDPGPLANELVQMALGHRWRPIDALQPPEPARPAAPSEEFLRRKAELAARTTPKEDA